jgi:hypothetical protein
MRSGVLALAVMVGSACGGGSSRNAAPPVQNRASASPSLPPEPERCSVIPQGRYTYKAAPSASELRSRDDRGGECTTSFDGDDQLLTCRQTSNVSGYPPVQFIATVTRADEDIRLTGEGVSGELVHGDPVVLFGSVTQSWGSVSVRLELEDCETVEQCQRSLASTNACH